MIVDSHQHPHSSVPQVMEQYGIDVSVLLPVGTEALSRIQDMVKDKCDFISTLYPVNLQDEFSKVQATIRFLENYFPTCFISVYDRMSMLCRRSMKKQIGTFRGLSKMCCELEITQFYKTN